LIYRIVGEYEGIYGIMKKVLIILTVTVKYGIGQVVKDYTSVLYKNIHFDFLLCNGGHEEYLDYISKIGGEVVTLPVSRLHQPFKYMKHLTYLLKEKKYDVVHVHGNSGTMFFDIHAAKCAKVRVRIAHCHSSNSNYKVVHYLLKPLLNREITDALACSREAGGWLFTHEYNVLNNAIDTKRFAFSNVQRNKLRKRYGIKNEFVMLNVGRLCEEKNQKFLFKVLSELLIQDPCFRLVLVGDGELAESLREQANELKINDKVVFAGRQKEVEYYYSMADCFLFPSIFEGLGIVLIEGQASGLKCVASNAIPKEANVAGLVEYIGLNAEEWVEKIISIKKEIKCDRIEVSKDAIEKIRKKEYDIEISSLYLNSIYEK